MGLINDIKFDAFRTFSDFAFFAVDRDGTRKMVAMDISTYKFKAEYLVRGNKLVFNRSNFKDSPRKYELEKVVQKNMPILLKELKTAFPVKYFYNTEWK